MEKLHQRFPNAHLHLRIDAAGQYADNIEAFVRSLDQLPMTVSVGQPKVNKDYHSVVAPKNQTDKTESYAMARYAVVEQPQASYGTPPEFTTLKRIASRLQAQVKQTTRLTNALHEALTCVFTELATLAPNIAADWVLMMLMKYPTAKRIAAARLSSLTKIPYLLPEKALEIQNAAKRTVSKQSSELDEELIQDLVGELQHSLSEEKRRKQLLVKAFNALPKGPHQRIATIKGIGDQTAAAIVATAISIDRFETDRKLVGYYGIFPRELQSGVDKFGRPIPPGKKVMCKQGNDLVRGLLWQCAKCASAANGGNPEVRALYLRRLEAGDTAMCAWGYCMTKLLRQVYGVWTTDTDFDPEYEARRRAARQAAQQADRIKGKAETEVSGHKDVSGSEETGKVVTNTPASMEPVSHSDDIVHDDPSAGTVQAEVAPTAARPLIDFAELRSRISMADVLTKMGYSFRVGAGQHRGKCPLHDPSVGRGKPFSVNFKREVFRCFESSCGCQGNVLDLWSAYRKLPLYESALDLAKTFNIELPDQRRSSPRKKQKKLGGHTPPTP
ncbi:transposase [Novipirellula aureliae]|nr:transposase [Novipirellula aureliae]